MKILAEQGKQANEEPPDCRVVRRRPLEDAEWPLTVREAARFLGVSPQTVYLWVERKQIPSPRDGPQHPVSQIGSRALPQPLQAGGGGWHDHVSTRRRRCVPTQGDAVLVDPVLGPHREAPRRTDRHARLEGGAEEITRTTSGPRYNVLEIVLKGEQLTFKHWADLFLENYRGRLCEHRRRTRRTRARSCTCSRYSPIANWQTCRETQSKATCGIGSVSV